MNILVGSGLTLSRPTEIRRPAALTLAYAVFFAGVFGELFQLRLGGVNFTISDAATLTAAVLIIIARGRLRFVPPGLLAASYVFLTFAIASTLRAPQPFESVTHILQYVFTFFVQLPVILCLTRSRAVVHASLAILVAARLVEMVGAFLVGRTDGAGRTLPIDGDSANQFAYPTAYLLPFVLYGLLRLLGRRRWMTNAATILAAVPVLYLMLWVLAASGSRSATVSAFVAVLVFITFRRGFHVDRRILGRLVMTIAVVGISASLLYETGYFPSTLQKRVDRTLRDDESLTQDRLNLAKAGWDGFLSSPFIGVGLDNFRHVAHRYGDLTASQDPHNMWIDLLVKVGIFGTAGMFAVIASWFLLLLRKAREAVVRSDRELVCAFVASMAAIMTFHLFIPSMLQRQYWLIFGLGLAWALQRSTSNGMSARRTQGGSDAA